ncbi:putative N-acetylmannosamine-6-phosphate 2-epimerase [Microbacterium sp. BWT-B31]
MSCGALVVSCQAPRGSAIDVPLTIAAIAEETVAGGAEGLRIEGVDDIAAVRRALPHTPIIGLLKQLRHGPRPLITIDQRACDDTALAGADMIALDASIEAHPHPDDVRRLIDHVHRVLELPVMADVSTLEEAQRARDSGADWVGTTLSGYTPYTRADDSHAPDLALLRDMIALGIPAVLEGHVSTPADVAEARLLGARVIVVGTAVTNPRAITAALNAQWRGARLGAPLDAAP